MESDPLSTSAVYSISEGVSVKGEEEYFGIFFDNEEKVVEKQVKRQLTPTPEEFVAQEQDSTEKERRKALSRYYIKKALLQKQGHKQHGLYRCPKCFERGKLRLVRISKNGDTPGIADYMILCDTCIKKRKEDKKKTKLWSRKPGSQGGSLQSTEIGFFNSIRALVFERDGKACVWCGSKENLGLGPLIPPSRGGQLYFDNYVVTCSKCRPAKGNKLPLEYIWDKISLDYWLHEQLDHEPTATPGVTARVNLHLIAEIQQYLHRQAAGEQVDRSKAERLAIKLSESDEDRRRERQQSPW